AFAAPTVERIVRGGPVGGPGFSSFQVIPLSVPGSGVVGSILGGFWTDREMLGRSDAPEVDLTLLWHDQVIASTATVSPALTPISFPGPFSVDLGEEMTAEATPLAGGLTAMASTSAAIVEDASRTSAVRLFQFLGVAIVAVSFLAYFLARLLTRPLETVAEGARAIAEGRFDFEMPVGSSDEVGRLAEAFNDMSDHLKETISELSSSRDRLHRTVLRVGDTLRSTHDMQHMLESILNAARDAVEADAAVLWMFTEDSGELYPTAVEGVPMSALRRMRFGEGIVGLAAETGTVLVSAGLKGATEAAPGEPPLPIAMAAPMTGKGGMTSILTVYRKLAAKPFTDEDLSTVRFLAEQGGVAIENVLLHEQAQRLSLTDGLTGVWNRRYLEMQFRQAIATSARFDRPLSLLLLDLDHFKRVNDTYGHQRGDDVLIELAQRVDKTLREADGFARFGGEEFTCLLSETDEEGALITAEKILRVVRETPFGKGDQDPIQLTVSIGAASYPAAGTTSSELTRAADQALYRAKREGRNRIRVADKPQNALRLAR
nr:diguanylate cyclase [Actinomycetota bacterium]